MSITRYDTFTIEEYKALRQEILERTKDVRELNRWGLVGLSAIYGYVLPHSDNMFLLGLPVGFSAVMFWLLWEQHGLIYTIGKYIRNSVEPGLSPNNGGWERFWSPNEDRRPLWQWGPSLIWIIIFIGTYLIAVFLGFEDKPDVIRFSEITTICFAVLLSVPIGLGMLWKWYHRKKATVGSKGGTSTVEHEENTSGK
jgi:hypothetical protein